ncbi:response regulator [Pseudomonas cremoricolorata]|uniref:histidine kinase n=1 Tax=Pseudomonas cremoricolorata TaxID=157783 RepID=A0A089YHL6_9PSED|nr:response regulator [Pseudomonas cremoricolorata]AIR91153.1 histidine kinase [Pseudomonas cremoricolorata]
MARTISLDERALILAPSQRADHTSQLLSRAGFGCAATDDLHNLGQWLVDGAAMAIVDEHSLSCDLDGLRTFLATQPPWSDLPVLLLCAPQSTSDWAILGNLFLLPHPCQDVQLLGLVKSALRARQLQYRCRDQLSGFDKALQRQARLSQQHQDMLHHTRKMEAIGQLAGGVAHDFNNLLTSIGGSLEIAGRRLDRGQIEGLSAVLNMGREAVNRAARLTHRLLAFSSRQSLESQPIDVAGWLRSAQLASQTGPGITVQLSLANDLWQAQADPAQLTDAFDNLLCNACEAMPSGGVLKVEARNCHFPQAQFADALPAGDYLSLTVTDSGQGMAPGILEHAFEPFFSTKPTGQGIGMGLSMVYGFSKQSGGHVTLSSQIGLGTQATLYLPRFVDHCAEAPQRAQDPIRDAHAGPTEFHVLIVEDDHQVRQMLHQTLTEEGLACSCAADAGEALELLRSGHALDLLITDVGLPGMSGRQLAQIARTHQPELRVLFITGYAETAMAREAFLEAGMDLLCKPFAMQQVRDRVLAILQGE